MDAAARRTAWGERWRLPLVALEFLTVLRLRKPAVVESHVLGASQAFFPLVGLLLGGLLAGALYALPEGLGPGLSGWLLMALLLALSGAIHADGLADSADGLFISGTAAKRLEVMRDPAVGAFGAIALVVVLGIKATALGSIVAHDRPELLVLAPALSRWACVASIASFGYARDEGLGAAFHERSWPWAAPLAAVIALLAAVVAAGASGAGGFLVATAVGLALAAFIAGRIGGLTGDSYGVVVEVSETVLVVVAAAWVA